MTTQYRRAMAMTVMLLGHCLAASAQPAQAGELWSGTSVGMTVADVERLYPQARPPVHPFKNQYREDTLLQLQGAQVGANKQNVELCSPIAA